MSSSRVLKVSAAGMTKEQDNMPTVQSVILSAPIMLLSGHKGEVLSCRFSQDRESVASGSTDKLILLWRAYGKCENYMTLKGHSGAITQLQWDRDSRNIYSSSSDKTLIQWDHETGQRVRRFIGHENFVNSCSLAPKDSSSVISSGSDDTTIKIWDPRIKRNICSFKDQYQVICTELSKDGACVFSAGIDSTILAWDIRMCSVIYTLRGHTDSITGLRLSPDGTELLSYSMDNTLRIWDVKPSTHDESRIKNMLIGNVHGFEKNIIRPCWSPNGFYVGCGSADKTVTVWDIVSKRIACKLPGHKGCVNEVDCSNSLILSCSNDYDIYLGELDLDDVSQDYINP